MQDLKPSQDKLGATLPASWYRSPEFFELEKRAIFSKMWHCVSHEMRFKNVGDYVSYEIAGYGFFVIRDRMKVLKGFLNVCRHRAYPIVEKSSGTASILACKYHGLSILIQSDAVLKSCIGWSYGLSGNLAKAPRFDTVDDFEKERYSLFEIHLHIDKLGWVWVNLDAANPPSVPWNEKLESVDRQARLGQFSMAEFSYSHTWTMNGDYNWKNIIDNYNEVSQVLLE